MSFVPSTHAPCAVPADFDQDAFHFLAERASVFSHVPAWKSYASGSNGIAFRFAAADEAHDQFVAAISGATAFTPSGPRYVQEVSLFAFFVNALSTLECFHFAAFNLGACLVPTHFPAATRRDLRKIDLTSTLKGYRSTYPSDPFTAAMVAVNGSRELERLKEHRDTLAHRGTQPRAHDYGLVRGREVSLAVNPRSVTVASNPKDVPTAWVTELVIAPDLTAAPREWLGRTINMLMRECAIFLVRHAPPPVIVPASSS